MVINGKMKAWRGGKNLPIIILLPSGRIIYIYIYIYTHVCVYIYIYIVYLLIKSSQLLVAACKLLVVAYVGSSSLTKN